MTTKRVHKPQTTQTLTATAKDPYLREVLERRSVEERSKRTDRLIPLHDKVVVTPIAEDEKIGRFWVPETSRDRPTQGRVVAVGLGMRDERGKLWPMTVKVGDRILFGKYLGNWLKLGDEEFMVLREVEIYVTIRED